MAKITKAPNLTQQWWSKNKAKTLKSTGFGKSLKSWAEATKKFDAKKLHSLDEFDSLFSTFDKTIKVRDAALKACNKKLHKDTIEVLKSYDKLFMSSMKPYSARRSSYEARLLKWNGSAAKAMKELQAQAKRAIAVEKNTQSLIKAANAAKLANDSSKTQAVKKLMKDFQSRAKDISTKSEQIFKPFEDPVSSGLMVEDAYNLKTFPKMGNISSLIEGTVEGIEENCEGVETILSS